MMHTNHTSTALPFRSKLDLMGIRFMVPEADAGAGGDEAAVAAQAAADAAAAAAGAGGEGDGQDIEGADQLGDAGKKALDAMKKKWKTAEAAATAAEQQRVALQAQIDGKQAEHDASIAAQKVKDDALSAANDRIKKAEVRAAAATKLADPADALRFIDLSEIEVNDDGEVDATAISAALDDLIREKPYLAAQGGSRFQGRGDGGHRKGAAETQQYTQSDVDAMTPEQVNEARKSGRLNKLLGA